MEPRRLTGKRAWRDFLTVGLALCVLVLVTGVKRPRNVSEPMN
jgi:hypothetical protein